MSEESEIFHCRLKVSMIIDQKLVNAGTILPLKLLPEQLRKRKYIEPVPYVPTLTGPVGEGDGNKANKLL